MRIHRDAPSFEEQSPLAGGGIETGIKVIDLLAPYAKGGRSDSLEEPGNNVKKATLW